MSEETAKKPFVVTFINTDDGTYSSQTFQATSGDDARAQAEHYIQKEKMCPNATEVYAVVDNQGVTVWHHPNR
ncbi:MAG: hypothetical protein A2731_04045 [Candidatus Buchananbacteria bacterium RIFCSPHIGHO2_01_FULL_39_8]|uniref:FERM domain-containing protein n=1 Tax=Candidatus Buchananbacteria bacterium RIFCSPHIGHO2_01_FULL_39_8 TaxID=1797533 RepID=A0A1G1Y0P5_9BACT|nr:hypothetical protein [uncultured bacterium]OGY45127.1 MAG: hypothetical protein A2731_04045 [Candidatus Buchananbacteria bacterium RIFCSPHIGHO2_01_FULL_39_8]